MLNPTILNEEPAAVTIRDRLDFVSTANLCPWQKDDNDALIHARRSRRK